MPSQHIVIVGGSSGIGKATAERLLEAGMRVTIAGRREAKLADAARSLPGVATAVIDAGVPEGLAAAFAALGPIDHLILAAGGNRGMGPIVALTAGESRAPFDDKVFPLMASIGAALPMMRGDGSITLVSAVSARAAMPGTAAIAAANAAVEALVPVLAAELKPMRVNAVSPGVIDTAWWDFVPEDQKVALFADFAGRTPVGRVGQPDDIARAIAFLVDSTFTTGHVLVCDGGVRLSA